MDCVKLPFVFLLIVKLLFAAPYGIKEVMEEREKIREELKCIPSGKREDVLIEFYANERLAKANERLEKEREQQKVNSEFYKRGVLQNQKEEAFKLAEKAGVFAYLRSLLEVYEWLLDNNEVKSKKVTDEELKKLGLPIDMTDHTIKNSLKSHYIKWLGILENDANPRIAQFKLQVMPELGFKNNEDFAKYAAFLFCKLFNIGHNFPSDMINFGNEEKLITALKSWDIKDRKVLNTVRAFYRLVRFPLPRMSTSVVIRAFTVVVEQAINQLIAYSPTTIPALEKH